MAARLIRWFEERPVPADACLALALLLAFVLPSDLGSDSAAADLAFSVPLMACIVFRRRAPVAVFAAVSVICLAQIALLDHAVTGDVAALISLYTVVALAPDRRLGAAATVCTVAGALLGAVRWDTPDDGVSLVQAGAATTGSALLAASLGAWRRSRRAQLAALRERNRLLALERDQQAAVGAALERARIARELHDVVAHSLSVIVVQADGAAAGASERPDAAAAALRTVAETGRDALVQMRRLLGVLRSDDEAGLAPQPGARELEALVAQVVRAGLPAGLAVQGEPRPLHADVDVAIYRLVQEALTNVLKHAGAVSRVDVVVRYAADAVEVTVTDDGRGAGEAGDGAGQGLRGMRERVEMHDGTFAAGPSGGAGFAVRAVVPTEKVTARA